MTPPHLQVAVAVEFEGVSFEQLLHNGLEGNLVLEGAGPQSFDLVNR